MNLKNLATISAFLIFSATAMAQAGDASGSWNADAGGVVLDGYDVVAYFNRDAATKGAKSYKARHDGGTFYFASAANRDAFKKSPGKYTPAYGGYCAYAVAAKNAKVKPDPETFKIYNGKLLVFFNDLWDGKKFNTKVPWNQDEQAMHSKAESNRRKLK